MSQPHLALTPSDLADHPELAALQILDTALGMAKFAIIAVHPELTDADPAAATSDIEVLAAEHAVIAMDNLNQVIESYRSVIRTNAGWLQLPSKRVRDDPF